MEKLVSQQVSVVIRARNEGKNLERLLPILERQTVPHEIVLVNNASIDHTLDVAQSHRATIVEIEEDEFTYPKASNLGVLAARGKHIVMLSAHSFPRKDDWLEKGLMHMTNPNVAGVYCKPIARRDPDTSYTDKVFSRLGSAYRRLESVRRETEYVPSKGQLGSTNALYRGSLLREKPFNEAYGAGGEGVAWAKDRLAEGLLVIRDPEFTVYHSHSLGLKGWIEQFKEWGEVTGEPQPFSKERIAYRRGNNE